MIRYELDGTATLLASEGTTGPHVRVGEHWEGYPPAGLTATVLRTGQAARADDYAVRLRPEQVGQVLAAVLASGDRQQRE